MLESTFDNQDRFTAVVKDNKPKELEQVNLGKVEAPKKVYIGKRLSPEIKKTLIDLLRKLDMSLHGPMMILKHIGKIYFSMLFP